MTYLLNSQRFSYIIMVMIVLEKCSMLRGRDLCNGFQITPLIEDLYSTSIKCFVHLKNAVNKILYMENLLLRKKAQKS